jgi:eukaryotic-like serine/threonine-protein kinase
MVVRSGLLPGRYAGPVAIGQGGMGEIYRVRDTMLDRTVAVKVLARRYADDDAVRARFTREALAVARLSNTPHVVRIYDVGEWDERPFIVMEYLPGGSLAEVLRREGVQPPRRVLDWLGQAASALDTAHRAGIVHRDVKPANLLHNAGGQVTVVDFGIASAAGLDRLTLTGTVLGTAGYLSPEQAQGEEATPASDEYALAIVAFELLVGRRPFESDSVAAEAAAHVTAEVPSACAINPSLPSELDIVFARALAKAPAARYASCFSFVAPVRQAFEPTEATPAVGAAPARLPGVVVGRGRRRRLGRLGLLLVLAAAGGAIAAAIVAGGHGPPRARVTVTTLTTPGSTVVRTVTTPGAAPPSATRPASSDPHQLNDQAWSLMKQGNYGAALPLLERAVRDLQHATSDVYDAYANYNLGVTLTHLGHCSEALPHLALAQHLEPTRPEVRQAIQAAKTC